MQNRSIFHLCWYELRSVCNSECPIHTFATLDATQKQEPPSDLCVFQWFSLIVNAKILTPPRGPRRLNWSGRTLTYFVLSSVHVRPPGLCCSSGLQIGCFLLPPPGVLFPRTALSFTLSPPLQPQRCLPLRPPLTPCFKWEHDCLP